MTKDEFDQLYNRRAGNNFGGHANLHHGWWAQQHPEALWEVIRCAPPDTKKILEIGVNDGGSLVFWDHLAGPGGITVGMDDGGYIDTQIFSMFRPEYGHYVPVSQLHIIQGNSHHPEPFQIVKEIFGGLIDVLIIDGDHTYEGAKLDYEMYGPLVRPGGIMAVDDIYMDERVKRFWDEVTLRKTVSSEVPGKGMGIIYVE